MKLLKGWKLKLFAGLALASIGGDLQAQKPGSLDPSVLGRGPQIGPASYRIPGPPPGMSQDPGMYGGDPGAYGDAGMSGDPSSGMAPGMDPNLPQVPCGPDGMPSGYGDQCEGPCDRFGRSPFALFSALRGRLAGCRGKLRPYGEGGIATQRWFDVYGEAMFLARTNGGTNFNTTTLGPNTNNFVLGTNNVPLNEIQAGLSLQANVQVGVGSNLEVAYFGLNEWENSAAATSTTPTLFSFLSGFGALPNNIGFDDSDRSFVHTLSYSSTLNNGEINFRRRWAEPAGFFQGSYLVGVRYLDMDEQAAFTARGEFNNTFAGNSPRFLDYTVNTQNALVGFQVGGDLWYNIVPGVKLGVEGKTGVYNNRAHQNTSIFANSLPNTVQEEVLSNRAAYITQFVPQVSYRLNHSWAFRSSYQLIYIDNVALATENFNAIPPTQLGLNLGRTPRINNDAEILLQGFTLGAEYTW